MEMNLLDLSSALLNDKCDISDKRIKGDFVIFISDFIDKINITRKSHSQVIIHTNFINTNFGSF